MSTRSRQERDSCSRWPGPSDQPSAGETAEGVVLEVACLNLQKAQDAMRSAGFFYVTVSDATGQGRQQLVDRNWVVVSQSEPAGDSLDPTTRSSWGR